MNLDKHRQYHSHEHGLYNEDQFYSDIGDLDLDEESYDTIRLKDEISMLLYELTKTKNKFVDLNQRVIELEKNNPIPKNIGPKIQTQVIDTFMNILSSKLNQITILDIDKGNPKIDFVSTNEISITLFFPLKEISEDDWDEILNLQFEFKETFPQYYFEFNFVENYKE